MNVFVVESGCYEQRTVIGVYSSLEAAQETDPNCEWAHWSDGDGYEDWSNGKDWDEAKRISAYELESGSAPVPPREPDCIKG